tara:strand:+ start:455 stop:700 length:246 start_codon:yes stop_codon:yes gene_type:complete
MREIFLYISVGVFLTGVLLLLAFSILTTQPTLGMYILSSYFIICGIFMGAFFTCLDYWNSSAIPEKQELMPLETSTNAETL